jgi:hypothetical protein
MLQVEHRGSAAGRNARIALCLEFAAEMRRHAATKSKASAAYYSAVRNARVFLVKASALRAGARA